MDVFLNNKINKINTSLDSKNILGYVNLAPLSVLQVNDAIYASIIPISKAGRVIVHAKFASATTIKVILLQKSGGTFTIKSILTYRTSVGDQDINTGFISTGVGDQYIGFTVTPYTSQISQAEAQSFWKITYTNYPSVLVNDTSTSYTGITENVLSYYIEVVSGIQNDISSLKDNSGNLTGKIWNALGDSITEYTSWQTNSYISVARRILEIATVNNYGVAGTAITKSSSGDTTAFISRYSAMSDTADLITVEGGTNDYGHSLELGVYADTSELTFYGALKILCDGLISKYPTKRIFFITPTQRNFTGGGGEMAGIGANTKGYTLKQYVDAMIQVCGDYGIPVIDLYRTSGICVSNVANFTDDGLHWNTGNGANRCGSIIAKNIKSL